MTTTTMPREAPVRRAPEALSLDPATWERILLLVRTQHPSLNRVWFDQMKPRQLTNGVIQVTVATPAQLNFCQSQCQQPFHCRGAAGDRPADCGQLSLREPAARRRLQ